MSNTEPTQQELLENLKERMEGVNLISQKINALREANRIEQYVVSIQEKNTRLLFTSKMQIFIAKNIRSLIQ